MRILLSAALAASLAVGSLPALAQTATPVKDKACKTFKDETACKGGKDCSWTPATDPKKQGKCAAAPKPKTT